MSKRKESFTELLLPDQRWTQPDLVVWEESTKKYYRVVYNEKNIWGKTINFPPDSRTVFEETLSIAAIIRFNAYYTTLNNDMVQEMQQAAFGNFFADADERYLSEGGPESLLKTGVQTVIQRQLYRERI